SFSLSAQLLTHIQQLWKEMTNNFTDRCLEPMSEGSCSDYVLLWYFHAQSGECRPFVFGGCGGNQNRFSSRQECLSRCGMESRGDCVHVGSHQ
uniref:BPTI/Kunitz inhibitor domain-containing protein n=1 Tax=Stegastes partitus TaxID=144197 RepID=A0A3B5AD84_9TELE